MSEQIELDFVVPMELTNQRFDHVISELMPDYSRSRLQQWIKQGDIKVNGANLKPKEKLKYNDLIEVSVELEPQGEWLAQDIPLDVVYEDDEILVINKPVGLVVHPAAGNPDGTLVNAVLHHVPGIEAVPRAGIVHRLDKDTSGLMVVAKTLSAQAHLVEQLQDRSMGREYEAVVAGRMTGGGTVDEPIARHHQNRKKMAVTPFGKKAVTHYRVLERFEAHTHIRVKLETGRTHQIRVHMSHLKYPLVGDSVYAGRPKMPASASPELKVVLKEFPRQALHAKKLSLIHPSSDELIEWEVDLPEDMIKLLDEIRSDEI